MPCISSDQCQRGRSYRDIYPSSFRLQPAEMLSSADSVLVSRIAWSCRAVNRSPPKRRPTRSAHRTFHMSSQRYHILIVYIILCN